MTSKIVFKDRAVFCCIKHYFIFALLHFMLDAVTALDGKPMEFKVFQSSLLNFFVIFYIKDFLCNEAMKHEEFMLSNHFSNHFFNFKPFTRIIFNSNFFPLGNFINNFH